ncbi:class I SAM-dependent methyltransferase [Acinetobacter larvae]|uniref:Methyltransferase domain-containing protein n=1 Tax=Acinetobacter larvae TaxID=1789224 RepID=A0A1B2M0S8_9GAMM|nr:class I SAM-dependent methyltransferase [Acinetobacter larvae]AOA58778.1 hypothetical protein BFG52_10735 [Acinetobacter larvae]
MAKDFAHPDVVDQYDQHILKLIPGYHLVHQQIAVLLESYLPQRAHILVVGCGTGYELAALLALQSDWTFTATDLSATMLEKAQAKISAMGQAHRVQFIQADVHQLPADAQFDAALLILVAHFIAHTDKTALFQQIYLRLAAGAILLSYDLMQSPRTEDLSALAKLCQQQGLSAIQSQKMLQRLHDDFYVDDSAVYQQRLLDSGFATVSSYSQVLCYQGFLAQKSR